ncbi:MAG: hemolysin III [Alphaproteobacteria bacterium]|nr:MAG: hemolysin III [Alphaproteobacteria bacterium]
MTEAEHPGLHGPALRRAERLADMAIHLTGIALAAVAAPVLVAIAAIRDGRAATIAAVSVYAVTSMAMLGFSGAYHMSRNPRLRQLLRRFDHAAIYLKIAGTQTPFAVLAGGAWSAWLMIGVWCAAIAGAATKLFARHSHDRLSVALYLALGWAALLLLPAMWQGMSGLSLVLVLAGGLLYSAGVVFHLWDGLPFQNAIWHGFVLAATGVFYTALLVELTRRGGGLA